MIHYTPFKDANGNEKSIDNLIFDDLKVLENIDEGYSIEYKRDFNKIKEEKLPKAVSAFSNRSGGWFFIGINNDGTIYDLEISSVTSESLYSSVESRVTPMPMMDIKFIQNPQKENYGVVAIYIHKGTNTPYIANGSVFVRNGKSSDPADRSSLDLLIKQSMDYSDLELKCLNCSSGCFECNYDALTDVTFKSKYSGKPETLAFAEVFEMANSTILYLENKGKHYDENIELILKIHRNNYFDLLKYLNIKPNQDYEDIFSEFVGTPLHKEIKQFRSEEINIAQPPISYLPGIGELNVDQDYMKYLVEREYPYEILRDGDYYYLKIIFKIINSGQKMFLPSKLITSRILNQIEYTITGKHSFGKVNGKLIKQS